ncbi:nucleotide sugar dehydrogenase [Actinosynnema sp. NPDC020468]|uniref:nucleotide sugar dehydrogenase n=1 Tax=Actinosynnema sp. NPDC020468 TaxID=3154488 RepID=UPI0033EE08B9
MDAPDVVVVGLGFTGLPTAVAAAAAGSRVLGLDKSVRRVRAVTGTRAGSGLGTVSEHAVRTALRGGRLEVRAFRGRVPAAPVHVLCLPTPADRRGGVDLGPLSGVVDAVGRVLRPGDLVLVQSTCPPGTVAGSVVPLLERRSGLRAGPDFHVACAPMRIDPGNERHTYATIPRVVGGYTARCGLVASRFVSAMAQEVVGVTTSCAAELAKVFENTFRLVNISLVNEFAVLCRGYGVDVVEALRAAGTKPFGFLGHHPSAGAGGDCVPVAARLFSTAARRRGLHSPVVDAALAVNDAMPARTAHLVRAAVRRLTGKALRENKVVVLGVTYKPDTPGVGNSAAVAVLEELRRDTDVSYHDPYVPELVLSDGTVLVATGTREVAEHDVVLVLTRHDAYRDVLAGGYVVPVLDCAGGEPKAVGGRAEAAA